MPKVVFSYVENGNVPKESIFGLGLAIRKLVAEAVSTEGKQLSENDVDWIPCPYHSAAIAPAVGLEIETIGFPARKAKLTQEVLLELKAKIISLPNFPTVNNSSAPLIWVKYVDPDGLHI